MAENKTKPTEKSAAEFIAALPNAARRKDCETIAKMMKRVTGTPAKM